MDKQLILGLSKHNEQETSSEKFKGIHMLTFTKSKMNSIHVRKVQQYVLFARTIKALMFIYI